ncbi:MAG TPA: hypothetical protein VFA84_07435 [Acidimicrobiales bacterium]|nr:hypothetical protein [Acidimicrobiales bacterium]
MTTHWSKLGDAAPAAAWALLEALALWAEADPALPPVDPDDFLYVARVERVGLPDLHVFKHVLSGGRIEVDDAGELWRYAGRVSGAEAYMPVDSLADALRRAELGRGEQLAARTRRGPRRPGWQPPPVPVADEAGVQEPGAGDAGDGDAGAGGDSNDRTLSMVSASAAALSSR